MMEAVLFLSLVLLALSFNGGDVRCEEAKGRLPQQEIDAFKQIATKLKMHRNFSADPCNGKNGWVETYDLLRTNVVASNITCDCDTTTNVCHIVSIQLTRLNLTGLLPSEFADLTHLMHLDLSRNYLSGSIPAEWGSLSLTTLALFGNHISGRIPNELGNISTLRSLFLGANQLEGPIPATLGKLTNLSVLYLASNNLSGELPESLGNLKNLSFFVIDDNPISGRIPSFIGNWTQLDRLEMQGTSLEGPFPHILANLSSLTVLRVSDIRGIGDFPPLQNMKKMHKLDLSFNNLSGAIPESLGRMPNCNYMFLSNNMLNGTIPSWILTRSRNMDVSYNNFTGSPPPNCPVGNVILVSSYSSTSSNSIAPCLRKNFPCSGKRRNYNLFINCGGSKVNFDNNEYEDDSSPNGASRYYSDNAKWASSSIGLFTDNSIADYVVHNASLLKMSDPDLYTTARASPLSLRYYGLCLQRGNYNVSLHFAEIIFTDYQTFSTVGRRAFDVWIQGRKVLQDFDIAKEANGTGKKMVKSFNINVEDTLDIHFYWAGKGTNPIPQRGVYGPLISAISVTPNFNPHRISLGAIFGIVAGASAAIILTSLAVWIYLKIRHADDTELRGLELQTSTFSLKQIRAATNNFDPLNKIGEGGFGPVYKGVLLDGVEVAVKKLSSKSKQGNREFINEIGMISALQHPNLAKLYGCSIEGNQLLLVYEYMENNSLARALFGPEKSQLNLDWHARCKICLGIAKGLAYLHEESRLKIVHRDIKATNILLDKDLNAKISDFGLAKLDDEVNTHISTRVAGTMGYMAPEYAMMGHLSDKADVYSFGIVMMETVSGMSNVSFRPIEEFTYPFEWAYVLQEQGRLLELVDVKLGSNYPKEKALQMLTLCLACINPSPTLRPLMSTVVSILDGTNRDRVPLAKPPTVNRDDSRAKLLGTPSHDGQAHSFSSDRHSDNGDGSTRLPRGGKDERNSI